MKSFFKGFINGIKEGFICAFNVFAIIAIMGLVGASIVILAEIHPALIIPFIFLLIVIAYGICQGRERYQEEQKYLSIIASYEDDIKNLQDYLDNNPDLYELDKESCENRIAICEDKKKWYENKLKEVRGEVE